MRFAVILENENGAELDRKVCRVKRDDDDAINDAIGNALENWRYSIGDVVRILEIAPKQKRRAGCDYLERGLECRNAPLDGSRQCGCAPT